jgi:hypothetical protein
MLDEVVVGRIRSAAARGGVSRVVRNPPEEGIGANRIDPIARRVALVGTMDHDPAVGHLAVRHSACERLSVCRRGSIDAEPRSRK